MAKSIYIGVDGKARKAKNIYIGVDGKARKVKKEAMQNEMNKKFEKVYFFKLFSK